MSKWNLKSSPVCSTLQTTLGSPCLNNLSLHLAHRNSFHCFWYVLVYKVNLYKILLCYEKLLRRTSESSPSGCPWIYFCPLHPWSGTFELRFRSTAVLEGQTDKKAFIFVLWTENERKCFCLQTSKWHLLIFGGKQWNLKAVITITVNLQLEFRILKNPIKFM